MSNTSNSKRARFELSNPRNLTPADRAYREKASTYFDASRGTALDKLNVFPRFVSRQSLSLFQARAELFALALPVHGAIIECGVFAGGGLFTWLQLTAIHEPYNHNRRIVGFDTFTGLPAPHAKDRARATERTLVHKRRGGYEFSFKDEIEQGIALHDANRPIGHLPRVVLVEGDACQTMPRYLTGNPHTVVALLYLDFDLYEPTKVALETFGPRLVRGSVIGFDELNQPDWPGETLAVLETLGLRNLRLRRFPYTPNLSYAVVE